MADALGQMKAAFADAQAAQAEITVETMKHQTIMKTLEAMKKAFEAIRG
ncbi:MAG: hypothetical protein AAGA87_02555 [Pseudomonadota bacterium]